jgi:hypothetical protein
MTTDTNVFYEDLTSRMKRAIDEAVKKRSHTVVFNGDYRLDAEAQVLLSLPGSPFESAVYEPGANLGGSPTCYVLSDDVFQLLSR